MGQSLSYIARSVKHLVALAVALYVAWLLWSGYWDNTLLVVLGALSCVVVALLALRMGLVDREGVPIHLFPRLLLYAPWLVWEVVKSNVDVARRILSPRLPIAPQILHVKASQREDLGRVIYANSITLTPGTVSVDLEDDAITVHALSQEAADGLASGEMDRKVRWLEGRS